MCLLLPVITFYLLFFCRFIIGPQLVARRVLWNRVCLSFCPLVFPSFHPSFCLSRCFLGIVTVFSKFWHVLEPNTKLCVISEKKKFCPKNWENQPKNRFFWIYQKILYFTKFVLQWKFILFAMLLHKSHIKIFVPEIWAKMFSANQIARFFNQPYLQNQSIK